MMDQIIGQDRALEQLTAALTSQRVHHAWLFHGPIGVGKFTTAMAMAQVLLCHEPQQDLTGRTIACDGCASCKLLRTRPENHPDLHVVRKELAMTSENARLRNSKLANIPIDVLREHMVGGWIGSGDGRKYVDAPVGKSAMLRHGKAFIIDEAELLAHGRNETQNALLKTLEEPSSDTYIFLITSNEDVLLPTIRSRCQRVAFVPLDDEQVRTWTSQQLAARQSTDDDRLEAIVQFARGSLGQASMAMDYDLDRWLAAVRPMVNELVTGRMPTEMGTALAELVDGFATAWVANHDNASKDAANKLAARHLLAMLGEICRRGLASAVQACAGLEVEQTEAALAPWLVGIDQIHEAERALGANVNMALIWDNLVVQWASRRNEPAALV